MPWACAHHEETRPSLGFYPVHIVCRHPGNTSYLRLNHQPGFKEEKRAVSHSEPNRSDESNDLIHSRELGIVILRGSLNFRRSRLVTGRPQEVKGFHYRPNLSKRAGANEMNFWFSLETDTLLMWVRSQVHLCGWIWGFNTDEGVY